MPMNTKVEITITAVTAQYQSEPWVVMLMSEATIKQVSTLKPKDRNVTVHERMGDLLIG